MQCKSLNVWSVYFFFDTLSCQNYFFPGGMGGVKIVVEFRRGGGGGNFSDKKLEIPGRRGAYLKFAPWWEYGYFLELHITRKGTNYKENSMFTLTGSGIRNILFDTRLHNPAQLTFCPAQFTSKKAHNFHFFPTPCQRACYSMIKGNHEPCETSSTLIKQW